MKAALFAVLLGACAPAYSLATRKASPVLLHAVDMVAFSAGTIVGISQFNARPGERNDVLMWSGFSVAALAWLPYWAIPTDGRP